MSETPITIKVKRDPKRIIKHIVTDNSIVIHQNYTIPLPYDSDFKSVSIPSKDINPNLIFGRSGLLPFLMTNKGLVILFTIYKGYDRGIPVLEMSDFGGRTELGEDFITTACWEAAEESLGLVNFIDKNNSITKESLSSYNEDFSVIVTAVPTKYDGDINNLVEDYSSVKEEINGELEKRDEMPSEVRHNRKIIFMEREMKKIELLNNCEEKSGKTRGGSFNTNETRHIVYVTLENVKEMLSGKRCPIPPDLYSSLNKSYYYYPKIYFGISNHVANLIPYIENYFKTKE